MNNPTHDVRTNVFTRCIFFREEDTTKLEQQVNYFLTYAPIAELKRMETNTIESEVLITLWFDPMPDACNIDRIYAESLNISRF